MTNAKMDSLVTQLRLVCPLPMAESDRDLLARFLADRDEAAFAALLKRHGPMVFSVSRRLLSGIQDAEDVVQAAFLLLARKAGAIRKRASLGCWLHGVALRLSMRLKRQEMNRRKREQRASAMRAQAESTRRDPGEIQELLDTALQDLPEKLRAALILCCLEGKSQDDAAKQLGCPLGTVQSRLARARKLLRQRLAERGLALSAGALATFLTTQTATVALPAGLFKSTLHVTMQYASGKALPSLVSASVALLVNNGLRAIALSKMLWISMGIVALGLLVGGAGLAARNSQAGGPEPPQSKQEAKAQAKQESKPLSPDADVAKPRTDRLGDPLPPGALARLGTIRLRHGDLLRNLAFSSDGKNLLSADGYGVYIWDAATGQLLRRLGGHRDEYSLSYASFAGNGTMALATSDGHINIMDAATGRVVRHVVGNRWAQVALSPDGKTLALACMTIKESKDAHLVRLFDVATGAERYQLLGHQDRIHAIVFTADSKTLVTSSDDKSIRFWDVGTGQQIRQLNHSTLVGTIALAPDGKTLASVDTIKTEYKDKDRSSITWTSGRQIVMWDLVTNKVTHRLEHQKLAKDADKWSSQVNGVIFSPDRKTLVSRDGHGTHFWDVTTAKELPKRNLPTTWGMAMAFTPDGSTLATGGNGTVQLWDPASGTEKLTPGGHQSGVQAVAISADGRTMATGDGDKQIRVWDAKTGKETRHLAGDENFIESLDFVADGRMLISISFNGSVKVWEVATGKELHRIPYSHAAMSADGKLLVTCSEEKAFTPSSDVAPPKAKITNTFLRVWEIATGKVIRKLRSAHNDYSPLAFSPDSKIVYSWDNDKKVRLWEVATGKELRHFEGKALRANSSREDHDRIFRWAFSSDRKFVALGNQSGEIAIFDMATGKQIKLLVSRSGSLSALAFSADNRQLASGHWTDKNVHLWELATGQEFQELAGHNGRMLSMAFSADGKFLLTGNTDTTALVWDLMGTRTGLKAQPLTAKDLEIAWSDLSAADATRGQKAVRTLLAVPEQVMILLTRQLKPAAPPDAKQLARLFAELNSEQFNTRDKAMRELENLGEVVAPAVLKALGENPTLETKQRLEKLLDKYSSDQRLRTIRAVQVLELIDTPSARQLLTRLADGASEALLTREAKAAIERLAKLRAEAF